MIDQRIDPTGRLIEPLFYVFDAPKYVKNASLQAIRGENSTCAMDYADPVHKRFPIGNRAAVWTSAAFFYMTQDEPDPRVEARIKEAADIFNISQDIEKLKQAIDRAKSAPTQVPDNTFGVVAEIGGRTIRRYPLRNEAEVKTAAAYFSKFRADIEQWPIRNQFAKNILKAAADLSVDISEHWDCLQKSAGIGDAPSDAVADMLAMRAKFLGRKHKDLANVLEKTAALVSTLSEVPDSVKQQVMAIVDQLDRKIGLSKKYAQIGLPEDTVYRVSAFQIRSAADDLVINEKTGKVYSLTDIYYIPRSDLSKYLGPWLIKKASDPDLGVLDAERLSQALSALDETGAELFDALMLKHGVKPIMTKSKGFTLSPDRAELLAKYASPRV